METIPRKRIAEHLASTPWAQGEHVLIIGPTGSGKTALASRIIQKRLDSGGYVAMPITKATDDTFKQGAFKDFRIIDDWNPKRGKPRRDDNAVMVWPKLLRGMSGSAFIARQREVFARLLDDIHHNGKRTLLVDEMHMMNDPKFIGLGKELALLFHQGRSAATTMVVLTQRPAWIPLIVYPSVSHVYVARTNFDRDRLSQLTGMKPKELGTVLDALPSRHDFLYVNPSGDTPTHVVNIRY